MRLDVTDERLERDAAKLDGPFARDERGHVCTARCATARAFASATYAASSPRR